MRRLLTRALTVAGVAVGIASAWYQPFFASNDSHNRTAPWFIPALGAAVLCILVPLFAAEDRRSAIDFTAFITGALGSLATLALGVMLPFIMLSNADNGGVAAVMLAFKTLGALALVGIAGFVLAHQRRRRRPQAAPVGWYQVGDRRLWWDGSQWAEPEIDGAQSGAKTP